MINSLVR